MLFHNKFNRATASLLIDESILGLNLTLYFLVLAIATEKFKRLKGNLKNYTIKEVG